MQVIAALRGAYGEQGGSLWFQRWRMFWMSCAELFGYAGGQEWLVAHYRFVRPATGRALRGDRVPPVMKAAGFIACAGAALTLIACHRARTEEPIPPVSHVDLPRYMGRGLSFCWTSSRSRFFWHCQVRGLRRHRRFRQHHLRYGERAGAGRTRHFQPGPIADGRVRWPAPARDLSPPAQPDSNTASIWRVHPFARVVRICRLHPSP